jgi:PAS domain S-box-containing protein
MASDDHQPEPERSVPADDHGDDGGDAVDTTAESRDATAESRDATAQSRDATAESRDATAQPRDVTTDSDNPAGDSDNPAADSDNPAGDSDNPAGESEGHADTPGLDAERQRICPLVDDAGNQKRLRAWLDDHESYRLVEPAEPLSETDFDVCVVDSRSLRRNADQLRKLKSDVAPVLRPVLLLLPDRDSSVIDVDRGEIADNVTTATVDEIVSLPMRQMELEWRIGALLRMRRQSLEAAERREQLRLFKRATRASGHAIFITDTDGTIEHVNPAFEEITRYTASEAVGETPRILDSGEMSTAFFEELWETICSGNVWEGELINERADGTLYHARQTIAPVVVDGDTEAFVAVQNDVTEQQRREEQLRTRTHAIDEAPVGISITDATQEDNPMVYVNDAFVELTGYARESALGRNCRFLQGEETDPERVAQIGRAIEREEAISITIRNYRRDGTPFWNHLEIAPVRDDEENVVNWIGFQQDVTHRRERTEQLEVLDRVLRHNLRNDLNLIRGRAEMIDVAITDEDSLADEDSLVNEGGLANGKTIQQSAAQIVEASDDLLATTEKERAITEILTEDPRRRELDLGELIEHVARDASERYPDADITFDCPETVIVNATARLEEALEEIVDNAVVHNDSPTPTVEIEGRVTDGTARIRVADDGPEISEDDQKMLLGTGHRTVTRHGSGLGLWLIRLVVTRCGGRVEYDRRDPRGNVVTVELQRRESR